jgi:hypothetical protein
MLTLKDANKDHPNLSIIGRCKDHHNQSIIAERVA